MASAMFYTLLYNISWALLLIAACGGFPMLVSDFKIACVAVLLRFNRRYLLHSFHYKIYTTPNNQFFFCLLRAFADVWHSFARWKLMKRYAKHLHLLLPLVDAIVPLKLARCFVFCFYFLFCYSFSPTKLAYQIVLRAQSWNSFHSLRWCFCLFTRFLFYFCSLCFFFLYTLSWNFVTVFSLHATDIYIHFGIDVTILLLCLCTCSYAAYYSFFFCIMHII